MMELKSQIIDILQAAGVNGLRVEELSTELGADQKDIIDMINQLIQEGKIMQKQGADGEQFILREQLFESSDTGIGDLNGCPCFHCFKISKCGVRQPDSPLRCRDLEEWILSK